MLGSIERRLAMLAEMDGYHDWRAAASVGADIDTIRQDIMESVLPEDPESAAGRLEQLVDLEHFLFETADDSDGEISGALRAVVDDWGRAWSSVANRDAETVAELVFDAFTENDYGVLDEVIPALESVRRLYVGLQSFRSMSRMDASLMKASALRLRFSQSLASLRQRLSQAMVRSTTQRLGWTTKPFTRSDRLTISVSRSGRMPARAR